MPSGPMQKRGGGEWAIAPAGCRLSTPLYYEVRSVRPQAKTKAMRAWGDGEKVGRGSGERRLIVL